MPSISTQTDECFDVINSLNNEFNAIHDKLIKKEIKYNKLIHGLVFKDIVLKTERIVGVWKFSSEYDDDPWVFHIKDEVFSTSGIKKELFNDNFDEVSWKYIRNYCE